MSGDNVHQGWCDTLVGVGFDKVCVVNSSYQVVGSSDSTAVPKAWTDSAGVLVNENQELANDWSKAESFSFFQMKCSVFQKSEKHIVAGKGNDVLVAYTTPSKMWIVAHGQKKSMAVSKDAKGGDSGGKFNNPPDAYNKAHGALFNDIEDEEE